jgi:hypothetical protein
VEKEDVRAASEARAENVNDVSEIAGPRHSSVGPDPPETQQTDHVHPLPSRQPPLANARLCFRSLAARAHRCLRLDALSAPFLCLLTRGCTVPHCAAFRGCTRVGGWRLGSTPALPSRGTAPWLASALYMHAWFTLASTFLRLHLRSPCKYCSPRLRPCRRPCLRPCLRLYTAYSLFRRGRHLTCSTPPFMSDTLRPRLSMRLKLSSCPCNRACSRRSAALIAAHIRLRFWGTCCATSHSTARSTLAGISPHLR